MFKLYDANLLDLSENVQQQRTEVAYDLHVQLKVEVLWKINCR